MRDVREEVICAIIEYIYRYISFFIHTSYGVCNLSFLVCEEKKVGCH